MHLLVVAQQREQVLYHSVTTSTENHFRQLPGFTGVSSQYAR